ncbi:GL26943 [Drosophila persimilis]|uniref:GL26943 n=1 Tax=Drosophila persimilis TaxID=7234 RepID=B4HBF6_DROPE|nr:GL26943 [Drosophila persimilis]
MIVMTFEAAYSPRAAHYVKTVNAEQFRHSDPKAVKAIIDCHYVDDYVDSFATESVSTRVKEIHANAGFELCQFSSSSPVVEAALGPPGRGRFSSYSWLLRTTTWVLRFTHRFRGQRKELEEYGLTAAECEAAENLLFRQAQREAFPNEMRSTENGKTVASVCDIRGLAPYFDGNGVLQAYGRVDAALCMPYSPRRPIILSHKHSLTEMIVHHFHAKMKHQNVDATIAEIRTKFWITKLRRVLRNTISVCNM